MLGKYRHIEKHRQIPGDGHGPPVAVRLYLRTADGIHSVATHALSVRSNPRAIAADGLGQVLPEEVFRT
jgi:hypothetical protein